MVDRLSAVESLIIEWELRVHDITREMRIIHRLHSDLIIESLNAIERADQLIARAGVLEDEAATRNALREEPLREEARTIRPLKRPVSPAALLTESRRVLERSNEVIGLAKTLEARIRRPDSPPPPLRLPREPGPRPSRHLKRYDPAGVKYLASLSGEASRQAAVVHRE